MIEADGSSQCLQLQITLPYPKQDDKTHALKLHSHHRHFNIIFSSTPRFSKYSFSFGPASLDTECTANLNRVCHMPRLCRRPIFERPNNISPREPITKAEICTLYLQPLNVPPSHVQILSPALPY